ncbi:MAG TPA: carboxypeptidase M32 [Gemmataceae bacterium]|jgi:carboxypeptidase Taq
MQPREAYAELARKVKEEAVLASCVEVLGWDEETYMPEAGVAHRAEQQALLAGLLHDRATDPRLGELLATVEGSDLLADPDCAEAVNVRELRRLYNRAVRLPRSLVEEFARITSIAQREWVTAYEKRDWSLFQPWVEKIVKLKRAEAAALRPGNDLYETMLDEYEPGITIRQVIAVFDALRGELVELVGAISASGRRANLSILHRYYPMDRQRQFGEMAAAAVGFDFRGGRLDTSPHPFFSRLGPGDCRITTRFNLHHFGDGLFGILHEVGHALYEQGLDPAAYGLPMGESVSIGMHESQARLWENTVGRSLPFWRHFFPHSRALFPEALRDVSVDEFYFAINHVAPSLNRVRADEVTYNLHILIRFELERSLVAGDLIAADVPAAWNEQYRRYLGVKPPDDAEGCLQDGHWGGGLIGYFPTYTLGNLFAAQLFDRASADLGDLDDDFSQGRFDRLLGWLQLRVYCHGQRYPAPRLIEHATGTAPNPQPLLAGLRRKYGELYGL